MRCCDCEFRNLCDKAETVLTAFVSCEKRTRLLAEQRRKQINADRIRTMSDEELAEELVIEIEGLFPSLVYVPMATGNIYISRDKAEKEMLEYLQQPAEEETP